MSAFASLPSFCIQASFSRPFSQLLRLKSSIKSLASPITFSQPLDPQQKAFIGISLGGKSPMNDEMHIQAMLEALSFRGYTEVVFMVADDIARFNCHVFNSTSLTSGAALREARKEGDGLVAMLESVTSSYPALKTSIVRWSEINTKEMEAMVEILEKAYEEIPFMKELISSKAMEFYRYRRGDRKPKPAQIKALAQYILAELPSISHGIQVQGEWIQTVIYPQHSDVSHGGITSVWSLMQELAQRPDCQKVFDDLDAVLGMAAGSSATRLRTTAIDAVYMPISPPTIPEGLTTRLSFSCRPGSIARRHDLVA